MTVNMAAPLEVGICVRDMTRMVDFYTNVLELKHYYEIILAVNLKSKRWE